MNTIKFLALSFFALFLTSCNFTEEITFNEDGSGEFVMNYDMSEMMKQLEEMGMGGKKKDEDKPKKVIDSTIYFKDMLTEKSDSISKLSKEEQDKLMSLETVVMKMKMNEETGQFDFGFGSTFNSLEELPEALEKIDKAKKMNSEGSAQYGKMSESAFTKASESVLENVDFKYDGKTFSRYMKEDVEASAEELEALEAEMTEMGEMKDMFTGMSYTLKYNFPKPVKSVSNENATITNGGKTVILKMNFMDMMKAPKDMNLNVVLED